VACSREWHLTSGKWWFDGEAVISAVDASDKFKTKLKTNPKFYAGATYLISAVYPQWFFESRRLKKTISPEMLVVNIGAGVSMFSESSINVDLMPYPNVDVVARAEEVPLASDSVDILISIAVVEHVQDPIAVIEEFRRVLKPGGRGYVYVPFMQGFHAAPHDYQRYTKAGLLLALKEFKILKTVNFGPTSGLIWVLGEWLAIVFCFGSQRLQRSLAFFFTALLSPVKFLDSGLRHFPGADNIATGFLVIVEKTRSIENVG